MKIKSTRVSKSALAVVLALCMLLSCVYVGLIPTDAAKVESESVGGQYNRNWGGTVYFRVPDQWDLSTYSSVYCVIRRSITSSTDAYSTFTKMNVVGNTSYSRLYKVSLSVNHSNWNQNEFIAFCASNDNTYGEWSTSLSSLAGPYTAGLDYGTNSGSTYMFRPSTEASCTTTTTNNPIDAYYNATEANVMKYNTGTHYAYAYTNGSSSSTGGTTSIKAYYLDGTTPTESTDTKTPTASYADMMEGCKVTLTATANSGAVFGGWYTDSALTNRVSTSTTYSYYSYNTKSMYAKFTTETTYTVTVQSANSNQGSVASSSVSAGSSTAVTLPTATPAYGYKFKNWTTTNTSTITIANATSATAATVKASASGGTVTANFEPDTSMNLYIAGRFHIYNGSNWVNTFDSGDWSTTGDDNIKFTYDSGTTYKVETNASIGQLSTEISNNNPYFFVYDKDLQRGWHPASSVNFDTNTTSASLSTNDSTFNVRFNDASATDSPVTIYFNTATKELSYDVPTYYTVTCNSATGGSVTADVARQKAGSTVNLTLTPNSGYTLSSVTVTKAGGGTVSVSGSGNSRSFTMPEANVTISASFTETTHTVYVRKRYYQNNGTTLISTETTNTQTLTGVGISTAKQVNAAPTVANYTFYKFTLPTGVTRKTGDLSTADAITVNATVDNAIIYIDYKETLYTLTLFNNPSAGGSIKKSGSSTAITSIQVGNVTGVTLVATPNNGYQFSNWTKSGSAVTIGNTANASTTFKTSADATVTANYTAVNYTITAAANPAAGATVEIWNTAQTQQVSGGHIGDEFLICVNLNPGYAFDSISGVPSGGSVITNNATSYVAKYTLGNSNVNATIQLKAATPTISAVRIRDNTQLSTAIDSCTPYANGAVVNTYYKQPVVAKTTTTDTFTSTYSYQTKNGNTTLGSSTDNPCEIAASTTIMPTTETGYASYTLTVTATNAPAGVSAATTTRTYTIRVYFNDAQKAYFRLQKLYSRCVENEPTSNNPYYNDGAPIAAYNSAYATAKTFINGGYPVYNATAAQTTTANNTYNSFETAYKNLMKSARTTTVYVLTNYQSSNSYPINVRFTTNGTAADWNHLKMYNTAVNNTATISDTDESRHMVYSGYITYTNNRYLYTITYAGHARVQIWRGNSSSDASFATSKQLTGVVVGATAYKDYYINVYATSMGAGATSTAISEYADFDHTISTGKKYIEIGQTKTASDIKTLFSITPVGSIVSSPGIDNLATTNNTEFTIEGPVDKGVHTQTNLRNTSFTATTQGRYIVKYTTRFGYDASGNAITRTKEMTLYVAFDDVTVYVDMNDNVGNPILNFKYWQINEVPVTAGSSGATAAYLPYEMDLVTGSESIYKYTIKTSKLHDDYKLTFDANNPLNISYITVERTKIGENSGGFDILSEARITGEIWFKADSTHLTTFQTISCGSVTKSFIAVTNGTGGTLLSSAVDTLHGTGINTDVDEVYRAQYAGLYTLEDADAHMNSFHYVLNAAVKSEVKNGGDTYYFDKWVRASSANVSYSTNTTTGVTTVTYSNDTDKGDSLGLNFTAAPNYGDGENDETYIAVYKQVGSGKPVRVEITYKFQDFDTSDGNFVYDAGKETVNASYTKTVITESTNINTVKSQINTLAQTKAPYIKSNYFDYSYKNNSATVVSELPNESKLTITAEMDETPHEYRIILKNGNTVVSNTTGKYQQTVELSSAGLTNPVWKIASGTTDVVLGSGATGSTFTARYVSSGNEQNGTTDCQIIKVSSGSATEANHKSVVSNAYTEVYYTESGTEMLRHNFYIIDYCTEGELKGGGVLFATTDSSGNYRQSNAATQLANANTRRSFISGILGSDFETEYAAQTINNVGFRYKPFKNTEDVFRYSDDLHAYITMYEGTNVNSDSYDGQKLRLFSFMVYNNGGNMVVVPSDGYAEVDRYQPQGN